MSKLKYYQFPYGTDNYGVLLHSSTTGETACVDAGDASAIENALNKTQWKLTHVFITHHHSDHTAGLQTIKSLTGCQAIGPSERSTSITGLDIFVGDLDQFLFAGLQVQVLHTPGHTNDMINFHLPEEQVVFTGDTLFALGCGRLFEGDARMMWQSLSRLAALPPQTRVYCSHEYTLANAEFALSIDPHNDALLARIVEIRQLRHENKATIPTSIQLELETNPFLRAANPDIRKHLGLESASDADVFAEIRLRKDRF